MAMKETGEGPELSQISATHGPQGSVVAALKGAEGKTLLPAESFSFQGIETLDQMMEGPLCCGIPVRLLRQTRPLGKSNIGYTLAIREMERRRRLADEGQAAIRAAISSAFKHLTT